MNPESVIERLFVKELDKRGGFSRKYTSPGNRGVPDRIAFFNGQVIRGPVFVEFKTDTGRLSSNQIREFQRMANCGASLMMLSGCDEVHSFFTDYDKMEAAHAAAQSDALSRLVRKEGGISELRESKG